MTGHTVQKCYKLHGYPPGYRLYKGRKVASIAQVDSAEGHTFDQNQDRVQQATQATVPALTNEQYNQLMLLLNQQANGSNEDMNTASFLAGKRFYFFTSINNNTWIVDSGASDHITYDLSLLQKVRPI